MRSSSNAPVNDSDRRQAHEIPELKVVCEESILIKTKHLSCASCRLTLATRV
jgi:hypothetical protein